MNSTKSEGDNSNNQEYSLPRDNANVAWESLIASCLSLLHRLLDETQWGQNLLFEYGVLAVIDEAGGAPVNAGDLSKYSIITKSALSGVVKRFKEHALIDVCPNPSDRRQLNITLTPKGKRIIDEMNNQRFSRVSSLLNSTMSAGEIEQLNNICSKITEQSNVKQYSGIASFASTNS